MRYTVRGIDPSTSRRIELTLEAPDEPAARAEAARRGVRIESVQALDTPAPAESAQRDEPLLVRLAPGQVHLVELTAKRWKALTALGLIVFFLGTVFSLWLITVDARAVTNPPALLWISAALAAAGFILLTAGRAGAWWYHR